MCSVRCYIERHARWNLISVSAQPLEIQGRAHRADIAKVLPSTDRRTSRLIRVSHVTHWSATFMALDL
jgi:hypothetical protein